MKMNAYLEYPIKHLIPNLKTIVTLVHGFVSGENSRVQPVVAELVEGMQRQQCHLYHCVALHSYLHDFRRPPLVAAVLI